MMPERKDARATNHSYQRQIAASMVKSMGVDAAIDACYRSDWAGTMKIIIKDEALA